MNALRTDSATAGRKDRVRGYTLKEATRTRRLTQEAADTYQRALTGGPFYAASWLLVGIYGGAFSHSPLISWALLLAFSGLATLRFLHRPPAGGAEAATLVHWLRLHWGIVLATTALWGVLFVWATLDVRFGPARITALLFTLGLATAIAHAFSMRRGLGFACVALLCGPGLLLLWAVPGDRPNGLMMSIYLVYVVISLLRAHTEYQQRLDLDQELRNQRDLFSRQSRVDPLTELANRRQFGDVLEQAIVSARCSQQPMCLLLLDIDHFKLINDTHGHTVGDACLVIMAERLAAAFSQPGDLPARVGGEEFGVVLPGHDLEATMQRAEVFRANLAAHPLSLEGLSVPMTASLGIALFDAARHSDMDALYHAADSAVYVAKADGRNRVRVHPAATELREPGIATN